MVLNIAWLLQGLVHYKMTGEKEFFIKLIVISLCVLKTNVVNAEMIEMFV